MYGADVVTDWRVGSPIRWRGLFQDEPYENKGTVLRVRPAELLEYTYWSNISGLPDVPENYVTISCSLEEEKARGGTRLKITVRGSAPERTRKHMEFGWRVISDGLKRFLESS